MSKLHTSWASPEAGLNFSHGEILTQWLTNGASITGSTAWPLHSFFPLQVQYREPLLDQLLERDQRIAYEHSGAFECVSCSRNVKKLFDGFCFPCLKSKAQADACVMSPHLCHFHQGTCREPEWGLEFCFQPHFVYLSFTDKFKVGITRQGQVPTRWIDQGATAAALLAKVGSRQQAGVLEKLLTEHISDRSHWSKMLSSGNAKPSFDEFARVWQEARNFVFQHPRFQSGESQMPMPVEKGEGKAEVEWMSEFRAVTLEYPFPDDFKSKIVSQNLDKSKKVEGHLLGVKGQYLILDSGVFNVRRHEGYVAQATWGE
jgi:hypothetical protein